MPTKPMSTMIEEISIRSPSSAQRVAKHVFHSPWPERLQRASAFDASQAHGELCERQAHRYFRKPLDRP
jgi:hypothetical protein